MFSFFFFNDTATTEIYTLSLHDALPIFPYTRLVNNGDGVIAPQAGPGLGGLAAEQINASQLPTTKTLDLRLTKRFRMGGRELRAYADVRNLFNFTNVLALYAETGAVTNDVFKQRILSPEMTNLQAEANAAGALNADGSIDLSGNCNTWGDRKSTRLNSSHGYISYAVFCLKKKK